MKNDRILRRSFKGLLILAVVCALTVGGLSAGDPKPDDLLDMSLEQLMAIQVTSAAKKPERLLDTAAALFVISAEDIRHWGARSVPEALRMVPGLHVAQIDASRWVVNSRGFSGYFSNKLLVLVDGRSIYSPLFSGVFWEQLDLVMDDIDRIEVIRGPGATLWGANAVNGVINIITKGSERTQGGLASVTGEPGQAVSGAFRYGGKLSNSAYYRVNAIVTGDSGFPNGTPGITDRVDHWDRFSTGFQMAWDRSASDRVILDGQVVNGSFGALAGRSAGDPLRSFERASAEVTAGHLLARWTHVRPDTSETTLQVYYEPSRRDDLYFRETRQTFDIDFQERRTPSVHHEVVWGVGYRHSADRLTGSPFFRWDPDRRDTNLFSAYAQDEIRLAGERLSLNLGAKIERNDFSGLEFQPNIRVAWSIAPEQSLWGSVARAVRIPSRFDQDVALNGFVPIPGSDLPGVFSVEGSKDFDSEKLTAFELGYRNARSNAATIDFAVFYNRYHDLQSGELAPFDSEFLPIVRGVPIFRAVFGNKRLGHTYGAEVSARLQPAPWARVLVSYGFLGMHVRAAADSLDTLAVYPDDGRSPRHQFSVAPSLRLRPGVDLDLAYRYVGELPTLRVGAVHSLDAQLSWQVSERVRLSLVAKNLNSAERVEFLPPAVSASSIERQIFAKIIWGFK